MNTFLKDIHTRAVEALLIQHERRLLSRHSCESADFLRDTSMREQFFLLYGGPKKEKRPPQR